MIGATITPSQIDYSAIITPEVVENLLLGECIILHGNAKELAPIKDGQLKNSIMYKTPNRANGLNQGDGGNQHHSEISDPPEDTAYVGSNLEYAGAVEYGRSDMPNYPRQPYMRPAIDYSRQQREARQRGIIRTAIKEAYHG